MSVPGIRNNNPGNLRSIGIPWFGQTGEDENGFCVFAEAEDGVRAMARNLAGYRWRHGLRTVEQMITRWAPATENDTEGYIRDVCHRTGFARGEVLDVDHADTMKKLVVAIIWHENGEQPYSDDLIARAVFRALR